VKAQEDFLDPPENSLATNAIIYPDDYAVAETELPNNLPQTEENIAKGKFLFNTYCAVCHGESGDGHGYLGAKYPGNPPDISRPEMAARKDGFFFMMISKGRGMMPPYGYATTHTERWQIISYLRTLQQKQ
jgi:mono/diheme cytochrome c family protein